MEYDYFCRMLQQHPEVALPILQYAQTSDDELTNNFTVLFNRLVEASWELRKRDEVWSADALDDFINGRGAWKD